MYENGKMRLSIFLHLLQEWGRRIKENDGRGDFNHDIL
jgi:hypothetical protein